MVSVGVGRHLRYLSEPEFAVLQVVRWNTYYQIVNVIGAFTTKLSISLFILRIKSDRKLKAAVIIVMAFLAVSTLVTVITAGTQCIPLNKLWNPDMKGHCVSSNITHISSYVQSGFAIITDLFLTISPILILWNIRISMRKKLAIWGLMSLGLMATIANAMRNIYIPVLKASDLTCGSNILLPKFLGTGANIVLRWHYSYFDSCGLGIQSRSNSCLSSDFHATLQEVPYREPPKYTIRQVKEYSINHSRLGLSTPSQS